MILAFDTHYINNRAKTVCLTFDHWTESEKYQTYSEILNDIAEYIPGEFYKRELPCILSLFRQISVEAVKAIIVDGYVYLDDEGKFGLGGHLYHALERKYPVIGVAKTNFATIDKLKRPLFRGGSKNPLFITSIGIDVDEATRRIGSMAGEFRIPTLLKKLDTMTKEA